MKLIVNISGKRRTVTLRRDGAQVFADVDGQTLELIAHKVEAGAYLVTVSNRVYECRVDAAAVRRGATEVVVGSHAYQVQVSDPKRLRGSLRTDAHAGGAASVVAPMPGKVVRVMVEAGAEVEAGQGLVIVEAMKMQNEMKSPKAGRVVEVRIAANATVGAGDVLMTIE